MIKPLKLKDKSICILEQTKLPNEESYRECTSYSNVIEAIKKLEVRGAPLIGITAAYGVYLASIETDFSTFEEQKNFTLAAAKKLRLARPTAVNLMLAIDRCIKAISNFEKDTAISQISNKIEQFSQYLLENAKEIEKEDVILCENIAKNAYELIPDKANIITHCNTGSLATAGMGTALGIIKYAHKMGKKIHVFVDETRPLLQGARLTAWELYKEGIPYTLITDGMAAQVIKSKKINLAITGADRIAKNGDSANKIGTYSLAICCRYHNVPFYIAAPYTTCDPLTETGDKIVIEQRAAEEVACFFGKKIAPSDACVYNPAFDVTPSELITGIITDKKVYSFPYDFEK